MRSRRGSKYTGSFHLAALFSIVCALAVILAALCAIRFCSAPRAEEPPQIAPDAILAFAAATPAPAGTPIPSAEPAPAFRFSADASNPLAAPLGQVRQGAPQPVAGTLTCNYPLTRVSVMFLCDYTEDPFYPYAASVSFAPESGVTAYDFASPHTLEGVSLASLLDLGALQTGVNTVVVTAACTQSAGESEVLSQRFYVLGETWKHFSESDFSNDSYRTALAFFGGDPDRFLYRYQNVSGRYTVADPEWEARYITEFDMGFDEPWLIHVDAIPYYERLRGYFDSARVRVHGTNGDTGVLALRQLVVVYHGSYVSRFTSANRRSISHHALGATTDVNAIMEPNRNTSANSKLLDDEVRKLLVYDGIQSKNGVSYYDFTYSGTYPCTDFGVPETVINYLLYELAFYRAGFQWGHYYNSTSDGMHFSLTDHITTRHDGARGLRKVTAYYD